MPLPTDSHMRWTNNKIFAAREPYEMRVTEMAVAAHEVGERGADETEIDLESLDRALS
jgi:hypothetical protein